MFSPIYDFKITELDIENLPVEIFTFSKKCADQGLINNASPAAMKIGRWGKDNEAWWCTWIDGEIVSISGCCTFDEYRPDYWRLMFRTATLKEYTVRDGLSESIKAKRTIERNVKSPTQKEYSGTMRLACKKLDVEVSDTNSIVRFIDVKPSDLKPF